MEVGYCIVHRLMELYTAFLSSQLYEAVHNTRLLSLVKVLKSVIMKRVFTIARKYNVTESKSTSSKLITPL